MKGLGTVVGTLIFLLVALAVIGSLLIIGYEEQLVNVELSQAQAINSLKGQEQLQVSVTSLSSTEYEVTVTNVGNVASHPLYLVVVPVGNNGQIAGQPSKVVQLNVVLQPGQSYSLNVTLSTSGSYKFGVVTSYGNIFWS